MCIVLFDEVGVPLGMGEGFVGGPFGCPFGGPVGFSLWGSESSSWAIWGRVCLGFCCGGPWDDFCRRGKSHKRAIKEWILEQLKNTVHQKKFWFVE